MQAQTVIECAQALRAEARGHKRAERHHKRMARLKMTELRAFCEQHGIAFILETDDRDPGRSESNGNTRA